MNGEAMFWKKSSSNNSTIGRNSNHNVVIQDSTVESPVFCNNTPEMISILGQIGKYDIIQRQFTDFLSATKKVHPLYPDFTVKPNADLGRLVSTPETADALSKYPKKIKGTYQIDYKKYPHMSKSETPWDYAYRTQTRVELKTTAYREYLGEIEDPFPNMEYRDGMITIIGAPEFPPAVSATIQSGDTTIEIQLRRKPCLEYGKMLFGTISDEKGFDFSITAYENVVRTDFNITKVPSLDLNVQLARERLINEIGKTKQLSIKIGDKELLNATLDENELSAPMFKNAPHLIAYIENLLTIEKHTGCKFDISIGDVYTSDYRAAYILASSLEGKWHHVKTNFCDETRCDFDRIPDDFAEEPLSSEIAVEGKVLGITLHGQQFSAEKYIIVYKDAKVNNVESVEKQKKRKKKNIKITFRPIAGKDEFSKFYFLEGINYISASLEN